jgi:hypothetical protein
VCDTRAAAAEVSRLLGRKVETWQIRACIELGKGYIGKVSVRERPAPARVTGGADGGRPAGRAPLLRIEPLLMGIPPRYA